MAMEQLLDRIAKHLAQMSGESSTQGATRSCQDARCACLA